MKTLKDYPITFPYGATSPPYSPGRPHRGNDRAAPEGTPIVIGGTTIGLVGRTGLATGSHCHTQAGTDLAAQNTIKPNAYEFKSGTVVAIRDKDEKAWGKYVELKVGSKYIVYAHLSKVSVKVGDKIGEDMYKGHDAKYWHDQYRKYYGHTKTWRLRYESVWKKVKESLGKYLGK